MNVDVTCNAVVVELLPVSARDFGVDCHPTHTTNSYTVTVLYLLWAHLTFKHKTHRTTKCRLHFDTCLEYVTSRSTTSH